MDSYSYKPALLRGAITYEVTEHALICRNSQGGENWRLDWSAVDKAAVVDTNISGYHMRRLDLMTSSGIHSVSYNGGRGRQMLSSESVSHLTLIAAILRKLEEHRAGFPVTFGEHGRSKTVMFVIGVLTVIGGVGLIGLAIGTGVSNDKLIEGAVPSLALVAFGGYVTHRYGPWTKPLTVPAGTLAQAFQATAEGDEQAR